MMSPRHETTCILLVTVLNSVLLTWGVETSPILFENGEIQEYCQLQTFEAACPDNEVVVVSSGQYGRMRKGNCVRQGYGALGCSTDVLGQLDRLCSGRRECEFGVSKLHGQQPPCPPDLTHFLEASYYCQPTIEANSQGCTTSDRALVLDAPSGYISNLPSLESALGTESCPWRIQVPAGQRVNVTLVNFARVSLTDQDEDQRHVPEAAGQPNICYQYAKFREGQHEVTFTECEGGKRVVHAFMSSGNTVDVSVLIKSDLDIYFMLYYEAVGCPNPVLSPSLWVQRSDTTATVKCNTTGATWTLHCAGQEWQGETGNCTLSGTQDWHVNTMFEGDGFPYSILLVVAIGVALGVFLGGILLVCASKYFKRRREGQRTDHFQQSLYGVEQQSGGGKMFASQYDDVGTGSPRTLHYHGVHVDETTTLPATPGDKSHPGGGGCKCTFTAYGPPPGYHPAAGGQTGGPHMYESPQFDRKDCR